LLSATAVAVGKEVGVAVVVIGEVVGAGVVEVGAGEAVTEMVGRMTTGVGLNSIPAQLDIANIKINKIISFAPSIIIAKSFP
jgi:hypothetical protein